MASWFSFIAVLTLGKVNTRHDHTLGGLGKLPAYQPSVNPCGYHSRGEAEKYSKPLHKQLLCKGKGALQGNVVNIERGLDAFSFAGFVFFGSWHFFRLRCCGFFAAVGLGWVKSNT